MRRIKKVPEAWALLRKKDKQAWATTRQLLALPMVDLDKMVESVEYIEMKAPAAFKQLIRSFTEFYIRGPTVATKKKGVYKRREPM